MVSNLKVHFSSKKQDWETPQGLFDALHAEFNFVLDVCATTENKKCSSWFGHGPAGGFTDGLVAGWRHARADSAAWMNPPYGNPEHPCKNKCKKKRCKKRGHCISEYIPGIIDWIKKASTESKKGATVVALLPARTDTEWFQDYIYKKESVEIRFLKGRLKFVGAKYSAPFPSMVVIFRGNK